MKGFGMTFQKHWYLGFLGLIGVYELPKLLSVFSDGGSWWGLTAALWFLWFFYFVPETKDDVSDDQS